MQRLVLLFLGLSLLLTVPASARADRSPPNDFAGQIIAGYPGQRVGIGTREPAATLDVYKGEIKLGSTGAPFTPALAGTLRSMTARLQFCGGTSWRNVSLDKAE